MTRLIDPTNYDWTDWKPRAFLALLLGSVCFGLLQAAVSLIG